MEITTIIILGELLIIILGILAIDETRTLRREVKNLKRER